MINFNPIPTIKEVHTATSKVATALRETVTFMESVGKNLARPVAVSIKSTRLLMAVNIAFEIPELVTNVRGSISASTAVQKVKHVGLSVLNMVAISGYTAICISTFRTIGVLAPSALSWTQYAIMALFPLTVIRLAISIPGFYQDMSELVEIRKRNFPEVKTYLAENEEKVKKVLHLTDSKIAAKAQEILTKDDQEKFLKSLHGRVHMVMGIEVTKMAVRIAGAVSFGLLLFTPAMPAIFGVSAAQAIASLGIYGAEQILLKGDPFR